MEILKEIQEQLKKKANAEVSASVAKFVPHSQRVYGVKMPLLNEFAKEYKDGGFELAEALWKSGAFEERVLAAKLLGKVAKKDPERTLVLIRKFSEEITDWAVCDTLGMQAPKPINKTHAKEIFSLSSKLIDSKNLWQRRLALVLAEWYTREEAYHPQIRSLINKVKNDKEYYVKKAVSWIERNFEKKR